ncbi:phosphoribosyltransferase [Candidatus Daviesbacteria bacterium]|nr:phosphoribosyltransferase [Candidatus Daviesbacteria bacterium]
MKIFKDRISAAKLLAKRLRGFGGVGGMIVLGIPRGGVVVAAEVAKKLRLPLDIIVTRKIGHPQQPELALGAVDSDGEVIWDLEDEERFGELGDVGELIKKEVEEIKRREQVYRQDRSPLDTVNKTIILIDDGIATGATTLAAIGFLKRHGAKKIIVAAPVASRESVDKIIRELGEFGEAVVLEIPQYFQAVGQFYHQFLPVSDDMVVEYLNHGR